MAIELSIVIPTYNEKGNIQTLLGKIDTTLQGVDWEVVFVDDDSPDGTAEFIRETSQVNLRIRCLQRIGRRGLSSACIEGMLSTAAPFVAVMDADLQHDATLLIKMLEALRSGTLDIVVGSRYVEGGNLGDWTFKRVMMSRFATWLSRLVIKADLKDPMSGYFMLKRSFFYEVVHDLSGKGFKILLDIFASARREVRFKELPFQFGKRLSGESKLTQRVLFAYVMLIIDKLSGKIFQRRRGE